MKKKLHRELHEQLHKALDELVGDWISSTGCLPSKATVMDLMAWSCNQTTNAEGED